MSNTIEGYNQEECMKNLTTEQLMISNLLQSVHDLSRPGDEIKAVSWTFGTKNILIQSKGRLGEQTVRDILTRLRGYRVRFIL